MRVKTGYTRRRHHKLVLARVKGSRLSRGKHYKAAREADLHAGQYAFAGRKKRKRDLRRLWITRLNIALRELNPDFKYSQFIKLLHDKKVALDRKILAHVAVTDPAAFKAVVDKVTHK
ncbi:MAG: 50S ribosomal protein L20 [Candidatus Chisholmbacteria bacterium RIFCSPHIGHO2_01_FULL_48_12]|uniref:Large ribosomal subunit protein bL20 n=1 Tax=Candidatus Chisholmbacteria bacterium RIFCSPHIGHO2_01_FULL_48_12 TaxID=1797589 RepID=A0A1G1VJD9_9BACT|nr:MAG: 50S ribosomal protein L20 [Candidatus Chisholmbacteria bacterium RIFCSPHIGHO2_01_FULL_48_12]